MDMLIIFISYRNKLRETKLQLKASWLVNAQIKIFNVPCDPKAHYLLLKMLYFKIKVCFY